MWGDFEARINENEEEEKVPLRLALFDVFRGSTLRPGQGVTKKMVSFVLGSNEHLVWEIQSPSRNVFLPQTWQHQLENAEFPCQLRPYTEGKKDGGRHSALSRSWAFGDQDCVKIDIDTREKLKSLLDFIDRSGSELVLDPKAVARWVGKLRLFFPTFERFDAPHLDFDSNERDYKLAIASELQAALDRTTSDGGVLDAVHTALSKSNLLPWRAYWPISPKGDAEKDQLEQAFQALVKAARGNPSEHADALDTFCTVWQEAVPDGKADPARQIAEFLFLHLAPSNGIYIRHSVRRDFWKEGFGQPFPDHASMADIYRDELQFMKAVYQAFEDQGLAPRDMIDVQSALWVAHNYKEEEQVMPKLTRDTIENAMDAYDAYQAKGKNSEAFDGFIEPRDYWVRSSKPRSNITYPTKPLIGFIHNLTKLNGGWGQESAAAAQLHNSGFIITSKDNEPIEPPERYEHLIRDADRIRLCALNYYAAPAREQNKANVSIHAGVLAKDIFLSNRMANVCQALKGQKFQKIAQVAAPSQTGARDSTTTTFHYEFLKQGQQTMALPPSRDQSKVATNLVLYGPPGTGKTYTTAYEAVRLCLGDDAILEWEDNREGLMAEYRRLTSEGQIEFVTFHQSVSYEEFVEGLRPMTGANESAGNSAGFSLEPVPGLFRRISERAEASLLASLSTDSSHFDLDEYIELGHRNVHQMSLGRASESMDVPIFEEFIAENKVLFGFADIDWSDPKFDDAGEILNACQQEAEGVFTKQSGAVQMTDYFRNSVATGDILVISKGNRNFRAIGEVLGEYEFSPREDGRYSHRRAVRWLWVDRTGVEVESIYDSDFAQKTIYGLKQNGLNKTVLERYMNFGLTDDFTSDAPAKDYVLIIDEINRANLSKVFGELITLLEPDKRLGSENEVRVQLPYSKKRFGVPSNLHIIGTMNTADRSIALLDTALRRRFSFRELMPNPSLLSTDVDGINLQTLLSRMNDRIEYLFDREHQIGHAYYMGCKSRADVEDVMRHKIIPLLTEYFYEDWSKVAMVLGDEANSPKKHFLKAKRLAPPTGFSDDEFNDDKMRWSIKKTFDFSGF